MAESLDSQLLRADFKVECPGCDYPFWVTGAEIVAQAAMTCPCCRTRVWLVDAGGSFQKHRPGHRAVDRPVSEGAVAVRYQQDLQVSIHERLRRLMAADHEDASHEVRLVTRWIAGQPALRTILAEARRAEPDLDPEALVFALKGGGRVLSRAFRWPSQTEAGRAFLIWQFMRRIAAEDSDEIAADRMVLN